MEGMYRTLRVPRWLCREIVVKGMPLLVNEAFWSSGVAALTQCYSTYGLAVVAGLNIATTLNQLFSVIWMSMGTAVSILVGQQLGANAFEEARQTVRRIMAFSITGSLAIALVVVVLAPLFPELYNTTQEVKDLAETLDVPGIQWIVVNTGNGFKFFDSASELASHLGALYFNLEELDADALATSVRAAANLG